MNIDLADFVARIAFKNASELSKLIPVLRQNLEEDDAKKYIEAITKIAELISTDVLFKIYDEHPVIHADFKKTMEMYGRLP